MYVCIKKPVLAGLGHVHRINKRIAIIYKVMMFQTIFITPPTPLQKFCNQIVVHVTSCKFVLLRIQVY